MKGYIYKTTCLINGKIYIGQTTRDINKFYLGGGVLIRQSIDKYGEQNFTKEILKQNIKTQKILDFFEGFYIKKFDSTNKEKGYNILPGTANKFGGVNPATLPEVREKMSLAKRGKKHSPEHIKNSTIARTGSKRSEETKTKMSKSAMGLQRMLGFKDTEETKELKRQLAQKYWDKVKEEYLKTDQTIGKDEFRKTFKYQAA